jgi:predicted RNA polymerase sigma factor
VRGDLLLQLGRVEDARDESRPATMTRNGCVQALLVRRGEMLDRVNRS